MMNIRVCFFQAPFLPGDTDLDQLSRIFQTLGTPTEKDWPVINNFKMLKLTKFMTSSDENV